MSILRLKGCAPEVYRIIGPIAMNPQVMKIRGNLPIVTKETYTWFVLRDNDGSVKALVGLEEVTGYMKLQAFVVLNATKKELGALIKEALREFKKTQYPKLTVSVLNEHAGLFQKEKFELMINTAKTKWSDLIFHQHEKIQ